MDLSDEQASFDNLVNIASMEPGGGAVLRVNPGQSGDSYLIQKLEGTQLVGGQMPTGAPLQQSEIDGIKLWIDNGAPRN